MIIAALRHKLRTRGPLGFAADAAKFSAAYWLIAIQAAYNGTGAALAVKVARELLGRRGHHCDADCATDRVACCRNAEERVDTERLPKKQAERGDAEGLKPDRDSDPREGESGGAQAGDSSASPPNTAPLGHAFLSPPDGADWCDANVKTNGYLPCGRRRSAHEARP